MSEHEIPEEARLLVERRIDSTEMLDVLLLLQGAPGRAWTAAEAGAALGMDEVLASAQLVALRQSGILKVAMAEDARYTYAPAPEVGAAVEALAAHFREHPLDVTELIAARPRRKLRLFADAFRIRKDG